MAGDTPRSRRVVWTVVLEAGLYGDIFEIIFTIFLRNS
jgi:hypothetical protein